MGNSRPRPHWFRTASQELSAIAPAVIEADVRAAALAEALYGAGRPFRSFLYVTIGTGVSSCLMLEGSPYLGARGLTGTLGSSPLRVWCGHCGQPHERTLEETASGPALVARYNALGHSAASGQEVFAALAAGDAAALRVVQTAAETLGGQIGLAVNVLDPEAVVLGGGLGVSEGGFWERMAEATRRHIYSPLNRDLPILRAAAGNHAGWIGAAASAWRQALRGFPNTVAPRAE
jgi:glucokinase